MTFLQIQMALMQLNFINKKARAIRRERKRQRRENHKKFLENYKVPYNSSNDADEEDLTTDSNGESDSESPVDVVTNDTSEETLTEEFQRTMLLRKIDARRLMYDSDEAYDSTCSSLESLPPSEVKRVTKKMRRVRNERRRMRRDERQLFRLLFPIPIGSPSDADDEEEDSDSEYESGLSSEIEDVDYDDYDSYEDDEYSDGDEFIEEYENVNADDGRKRKIDESSEARAELCEPSCSSKGQFSADNEQASDQGSDKPKRQRLAVSEDSVVTAAKSS